MTVGQTSTYTFTVTDEEESIDVTVLGLDSSSLTQDGNIYTFSWTITAVVNDPITFVATDSMNVVSTLSPLIEVCNCQNGGNCTLEGVLSIENNTIDMNCQCTPGNEARSAAFSVYFCLIFLLSLCPQPGKVDTARTT